MKGWEWGGRVVDALKKYKYVLLVALVGAALLLWPSPPGETAQAPPQTAAREDLFRVGELEDRLERSLSQVEGAGEVTVVLTLKEGPRQVLAQNGSATQEGERTVRETDTVVLSKGTGTQEAVKLQELGPAYQGALVVAQGGDDPKVRLALSGAVCALTGLRTDQISICKGK